MGDVNRYIKVDGERLMRPDPYIENYRQLRKAGSGPYGLPQGKAHKSVVQCQRVNPESIHISNVMQNEHVIFMNIYIYI